MRSLLATLTLAAAACHGTTTTRPTAPPNPDPEVAGPTTTVPPKAPVTAPVAARRDHAVDSPSGPRNDPYYWLRDDTRSQPEVLGYLEAENAYTAAELAPAATIETTLFGEMRARVADDDTTVPYLDDGYWHYTRFEAGKQQPIFCRRKGVMAAPEEIVLDGNALGAGHAFYRIGDYVISPGGARVAWVDDTVGRNQYVLHVKELATGELLPDTATDVAPSLAWSADGKTLFYLGQDPTTLRSDRVLRHALGTTEAVEVYREADTTYSVDLDTTKSRRYVMIEIDSTTTSEVRLIDARRPTSKPTVFLPRTRDHEYAIEHVDGRFVMRTNADAKNFRVVSIAEGKQRDRKAWRDVIPARADALVESFSAATRFVAATVRSGGLRKVEVVPAGGKAFFLDAADPAYTMAVVDLPAADAGTVRYTYGSMVAPTSTFEYDLASGKRTLLRAQPTPTYDPTQYVSEYVHATATDGAQVPVSLVYKRGTPRDGTAPLLVYGYGSYGGSIEPRFHPQYVSLLDRGWVFALAHVRGGQELGRSWYEDGKLMRKRNTFTDFIAVTRHLVAEHYVARDRVFAMGGSAGGLLMGAILNLAPELYRGVVAQVPFVDVVTTMLDESIPLTTGEFDEWGNPKEPAAYAYMLSYSPYDNVAAQPYPSIYVRTGLWDSQVQYFEPAKWVAKLRATRTDRNLLLLDTDLTSGHGGASGRFDRLRQTARETAFLLHVDARPDARAGWPG